MSCATTPRQAPAPIPGVPFCVFCKAHVVTHESEIQHLDSEHKPMRHQGKILVDLLPAMSPEVDLYENMYETTTMSSTSTHVMPAALREQNQKSCSPMSTKTARTNASGLLALAASSMMPASSQVPTPTHANTDKVKSTVVPRTLKEVVPAPDDHDDGDKDDEIEVSIAPTPKSMTPQLSSPANSAFLPVAISEDQGPQQQEQRAISSGAGGAAVAQEKKKVVDDHEDDSLIEIDDDDETMETYEVIHLSDDTDVVEGGPRLEHTINRTTKDSEESKVASVHAAQIVTALSNLEAENQAALPCKSPASAGKVNDSAAEAWSLSSEKETPTTANTNVQPPTPKLVIEQTLAEQIPYASPKTTSAKTNNKETAGDDLPEYSVR